MKCPNCGNEVKGRVCKYCHINLPFDKRVVSLSHFAVKFISAVNTVLFPPAKGMFVLWTLCWTVGGLSDSTTSVLQKICIILFGYVLMCGVADFIYMRNEERYLAYKMKITKKEMTRLKKLMNKFYPYKGLLDEANNLANVANTTTDEEVFERCYNRLVVVLTELKKYECWGVFTNSPTEDLNNLIYGRDAAIKKLHERQGNSSNSRPSNEYTFKDYDHMDGHEFEYFCANLLMKNNFSNVEVTQGSGDHGIDILAEKDGITYAIQCKCYSSNIGNAAVQQAYSGRGIYKKDIAVVITNQYFTAQAKEDAAAVGVKLWDRDKLQQLIDST